MDVTIPTTPIIITYAFCFPHFVNVFSEQYAVLHIFCLGYLHLILWDSYFYNLSMEVYEYRSRDDLYSSSIRKVQISGLSIDHNSHWIDLFFL